MISSTVVDWVDVDMVGVPVLPDMRLLHCGTLWELEDIVPEVICGVA